MTKEEIKTLPQLIDEILKNGVEAIENEFKSWRQKNAFFVKDSEVKNNEER